RSREARAEKIAGALGRLAGMRNASGAYSLWGDASARDVWLTAYATGFMQDARDRQFAVPDDALARPKRWLLEQVQQSAGSFGTWPDRLRRQLQSGRVDSDYATTLRNDHRRFAGFAAAALVLARDRQAPLSTVRQLFDRYQERALSPLPLIQLAAAFQLMGDAGRMEQAAGLAAQRAYGFRRHDGRAGYGDDWLGDYGSAVRDYALSYALAAQYGLLDEG